jgi:hypothetical protein
VFDIDGELLEAVAQRQFTLPGGLEVWTGSTPDPVFSNMPDLENMIAIRNPATGVELVYGDIWAFEFQTLPNGDVWSRSGGEGGDPLAGGVVGPTDPPTAPPRTPIGVDADTEVDECGNVVIDLLVVFTEGAATRYGDELDTFVAIMAEVVNAALRNSWVEGIRIRTLGPHILPYHLPITIPALDQDIVELSQELGDTYHHDVIAVITEESGEDSALGWGNSGGESRLITSNRSPDAYRHELGHAAPGAGHCNDGYDNGAVRSIMCGNSTLMFSNPFVRDAAGRPMGTEGDRDTALKWVERAVPLSKKRRAQP